MVMKGSLEEMARRIRGRVVEQSSRARIPHLGSCLSCVDILVALYWETLRIDPSRPDDPERDIFILSKGHAWPALAQVLALRAFFSESRLRDYGKDGSLFGEHPPAHGVPGVEAATGSLGHGLPIAVGMSLASRILGRKNRAFVLLSDGECNEGTTWEAAMMASAQKLDSLVAVIDFNRWQATGRSEEILSISPLKEKWESFGWTAVEADGHDIGALSELFDSPPKEEGKPLAVVARTVKGKGVSFMEDDNNWHYRIPTDEEVSAAWKELGLPRE